MPFEKNAWDRAEILLGASQNEYWNNTDAYSYQTEDAMEYAIGKLLEFGRPNAAIEVLTSELYKKKEINPELACDTLLKLVHTGDSSGRVDTYNISEIIKYLQKDVSTNQEKLFHVEWAYMPLIDENGNGTPITLENRLASDPGFFCELIQLIYRADGEEPKEEPSEMNLLILVWPVWYRREHEEITELETTENG